MECVRPGYALTARRARAGRAGHLMAVVGAAILAVGGCGEPSGDATLGASGGDTLDVDGDSGIVPNPDVGMPGATGSSGGGEDLDPPIPAHCPVTEATGHGIGHVPNNFALRDGDGTIRTLWDHCGEAIFVVAGPQW